MKVNLYDFDDTIYDGDSTIDFYLFCLIKKFLIIKFLPLFIIYIFLYKLKLKTKEEMKEKFFAFLVCFSDIDELIDLFWKKNEKKIKDFYVNTNHSKDIIISASPYFLLKPICEKLKVKDLIASDVDKYTGKYIGKNCFGEEKIKILKKKYKKISIESAYSDSISDISMLNLAKNRYMVYGNKIIEITDNFNDYKWYKQIIDKLINIYTKNREVINYLFFGFLTTTVNLVVYFILTCSVFNVKNVLELQLANVISWIVAVIFAYITNRKFVFNSNNSNMFKELCDFFFARIATLVVDILLMYLGVNILKINDRIIKIISQFIVIVINYIFSKVFVFVEK